MRPLESPRRHDRLTKSIDRHLNAVWIVGVSRNRDVAVIGNADEATIKHPVRRAAQSDTIGQDIGPFRLNRPYVCGIVFGASSAVDELQARKSLSQRSAPECPLSGWAG